MPYLLKSQCLKRIIFLLMGGISGTLVFTQSNISNKYGLPVVKDIKTLQKQINENPDKEMVNLGNLAPRPVFDLKYTTPQNFMHQKLYPPIKTSWLRKPAAEALGKVSKDLAQQNLGIIIWDGYRPYSITEKMWEAVKDDRYAADPAKGSGHNRGLAIDLTLYDLQTGKELLMPTGFDNFSDTAHQAFSDLPDNLIKHRKILKTVMEKYGFIALSTEWWHFYLHDSSDYELLDIPFADLKKLKRNP